VDFEVVHYKARRNGSDYQWTRHYTPHDMQLRNRVIKTSHNRCSVGEFFETRRYTHDKMHVYYNVKAGGIHVESFYLPAERGSLIM
jgi:hypothetical protein